MTSSTDPPSAIADPSLNNRVDSNPWIRKTSTVSKSDKPNSDASPRNFATVEPVEHHPHSMQDQTSHKSEGGSANMVEPKPLDTMEPAPRPDPAVKPINSTSSTTTTAPLNPKPSSNHTSQGPIFDPSELQSIFPAKLPPRPPPKRNVFVRIFNRRVRQTEEDIECQTYTTSGQAVSDTATARDAHRTAGRRRYLTCWLSFGVFLGLVALVFAAAYKEWGGPYPKENGK